MNLTDLLHDAVDDVDPDDRLAEIRARTASSRTRIARRWYAGGAAALATAAAVAAFAVVAPGSSDHQRATSTPDPDTQLVAVYFVGDTPDGPRLFREFDRVPAGDPIQGALDRLQQAPADPDYRTLWKPGSLRSATVLADRIDVMLSPNVPNDNLARQQVVQTMQAALGQQLPVSLSVQGQRSSAPTQAQASVLNRVSISDPAEGNVYAGSMIARGRADVPARQVGWSLTDSSGTVVRAGTAAVGERYGFGAWETTVDLTDLGAGSYVFTVTADDGASSIPSTDTRTISVG